MITVGRIGSQSSNDRTTMLYLKSTDTKPLDVENASSIYEMDTGNVYMFDEETKQWILQDF